MLPYFKFTEDVQNFCMLMGFTLDLPDSPTDYVCMYSLGRKPTPYITRYSLDLRSNPLIPPEKVIEFLTLMLNGYSCEKALNELGVVWG